MNLINKQHIMRFKIGEHSRQIACFFQHRAGRGSEIDAHFIGNDIRQSRFT
ncbi:Uncharacterised protein [Salmonella enterica subsp. enterica serovar Bovismorbificans]|uniref:Uncharacterized protein n=1 Tax=Salmonella enterica subsp. enterica serovar Bovismorbificans TaxID=58097 RepID=A0A655D944_SALET|nr:Uncharacterised protein [Salmonella enterica subsp. enterica serovar Bovismorbificans]